MAQDDLVILPALYHWSPTSRRREIREKGLLPYQAAVRTAFTPRAPYVCFATSPSQAWGLSGDMADESEVEKWDLWQVRLAEGDEMHVRPEFGMAIKEVRVFNAIPPDRVWYVATRPARVFED